MADTNAGALCEAGRRDAQALTVTGRRRAHTGSIRHAARTLAHAAKAVTPETPDGAWLRDNQTLARTAASDAAAALRHAHTLRASGAQTVLHVCCAGLLRACGNALTPKAAQAYLAGFQDVLPLETAELALLVPGLQAAAVCALADTYAHDGAAAPALFTSLRALGTAAWAALTERCDRVGRILARDPAGVYPAMDAATRTRYRQTVARLARRTGRTEIDIAEDVLARAQNGEGARRHVGWFLLREVLGAPEKHRDGAWYIAAVIVGTLALSLLLGFATGSVSGAVLLLIPSAIGMAATKINYDLLTYLPEEMDSSQGMELLEEPFHMAATSMLIVEDMPGTTRDAIDTPFTRDGQDYILIDTAGLRRKRAIGENSIERYGVVRALAAIRRADVVLLVIDATKGFSEQDSKIAGYAHEQGKACIIVVNKWDAVEGKETNTMELQRRDYAECFSFMGYAPIIFISAQTGYNVNKLMQLIRDVDSQNGARVPTGVLNEMLARATARMQPPSDKGRRLKIFYLTQASTRPPTFVAFVNSKQLFHFSYQRYLINQIRENFGLEHTPIRLVIRERGSGEVGAKDV